MHHGAGLTREEAERQLRAALSAPQIDPNEIMTIGQNYSKSYGDMLDAQLRLYPLANTTGNPRYYKTTLNPKKKIAPLILTLSQTLLIF